MNRETDEVIYSRFLRDGNSDDLRQLLERHRESLTLFIYGFVHNMEDAEDIMLNAFAAAASGGSHFSGRSSFRTWLFGIARNLARKHMRGSRFMAGPTDELEAADAQEAEDELLREESRRELYSAMSTLPDDYRNALYLIYFEDMSHEEVAGVMHKTVKQVYNLVFRGKQALKKILEGSELEDAQH